MTPPETAYARTLEGLHSHVETLGKLLHRVDDEPDALPSIRRLVFSLADGEYLHDFPEQRDHARDIAAAPESQFLTEVTEFLEPLRGLCRSEASRTMTILAVSDSEHFFESARSLIDTSQRRLVEARSAAEAQEIVSADHVAVILLHLDLPDTDGRNLLLHLKTSPQSVRIPVIVVHENSRARAECLTLGAAAYFESPVDWPAVDAMLSSSLERSEEVRRESREDLLTGLPNRAAFREVVELTSSLAFRRGEALCVAILDFDHFKLVNDTYGHAMGDQVLCQGARLLEDALRKSDVLARWGGEEFVVMLPDSDVHGARAALEKALQSFRDYVYRAANGEEFSVTFSAGVVRLHEEEALDHSLERADRLLYLAKSAGRNMIVVNPEDISGARPKLLLVEDDDLLATIVAHRIRRELWDVEVFQEGGAARDALAGTIYDLYLLDIQLPGVDGYELLRLIRSNPKSRHAPVVMLTAMGKEDQITQGFALGADDYIVKPIAPPELVARLRRLLKRVK